MRLSRFLLIAALGSTALACQKGPAETPPSPAGEAPKAAAMPKWSEAISHEVAFDAAQGQVLVTVQVKPGFHAYTVGETTGKPLQLLIGDDSEFGLEGDVQYPKGIEKNLPVGRSVIVQGQAEVKAKVKAKSDASKTVRGTFKYQVCTDEACDRPRSKAFELNAS